MGVFEQLKEELSAHHANQSEFHQAVLEIFEDVTSIDGEHKLAELYFNFKRLIEPDQIIRFKVEWVNDKREIEINRGWRVQFNNCLGPYKGGLRFHPSVNESILKFLAFEQIFKNALTGFPMGGAKGGSDFNPKGRSANEIRSFCFSFMEGLYRHIGPDIDIPAGDIGVGTREIGFLFGHYLKLTHAYRGVLTGKHPDFGGSCGREEATGHGCLYFLDCALRAHGRELQGMRLLISGAGNVALHAAEKAIELGAQVLSLSDSKGFLHFEHGLTLEELQEIKELKLLKHGELGNFSTKGQRYYEGKKPWPIEADVALPCATQNEVDQNDMKELLKNGIQVVGEGANMPLTKEALDLVLEKNIIYLPGKATNAGGVAVSNFERSQNALHMNWAPGEVDSKLQELMKRIHNHCEEAVEKKDGVIPYKKGANIFAYQKVINTLNYFGLK